MILDYKNQALRHFEWVKSDLAGGYAPPNPAPLAAAGVWGNYNGEVVSHF